MNKQIIRDRKVVELLMELESYDMQELSESQLIAFKHHIQRAEEGCKWLDISCKCNNLVRKIDRELEFRFENMKWWGISA